MKSECEIVCCTAALGDETAIQGTYREMLIHARSICGDWTTMLDRSETLDVQMQYIGLPRFKRAIMNRYRVPFGAELVDDEEVLHCWIGTPLGNKDMHADLLGGNMTDHDNEVGVWEGRAKMIDFSIPWFCNGKPVRALQMKRICKQIGVGYETRVILPDEREGKILLFHVALFPYDDTKPPIFVNRVLKRNYKQFLQPPT